MGYNAVEMAIFGYKQREEGMKEKVYLRIAIVCAILVVICCWAVVTYGATTTVNLAWDANTEPDVAGYKLYQSSGPTGTKALAQTVGLVTTTAVTGLVDGNWCWVLTAFDGSGNESGYSNQVCHLSDTVPPANPKNVRIVSTTTNP